MNIAIVLSGGIGTRMGASIPKQYIVVNNQPIINYCVRTFLENDRTDALVVVVADEWKEFVKVHINSLNPQKPVLFAEPGETRQYSIYNALNIIHNANMDDETVVLVHDAVRPLVSHDLINRCYAGCKEADGVMPVIPVKDTIYLSVDGNTINSLLNRNQLWAGQSPEAFRFGPYYRSHKGMSREALLQINGSTELAFKSGLDCKMIQGDSMNFKITTPEDLSNFEAIILQNKIL